MAVTANQVQSLYLAYFGRPAEQAGLTYWTSQATATPSQVSASFAQQAEYTNVYGGLNRVQTIQELYSNLFNRAPNNAEVSYWNTSSTTTVDRLAQALVNGATGSDAVTLSNKVDIANVITAQAGPAATAAQVAAIGNALPYDLDREFVVNQDNGSSIAEQAAVWFTNVRTQSVSAPVYTINGSEVQSGGQTVTGNLNIQAGAATIAATAATSSVALNLADAAIVNLLNLNGTVGTATGTTAATSTVVIGEVGTTDQLATLNISLANAGVAPSSTTISFATGDSAASALTTINGSTSSAALTINATSLTNLTSLQGGSGNDTLTVTTAGHTNALTVNGNAGNDNITGTTAATALTINGGDGNDDITININGSTTAATTVNAGAGNDIVRLNAGDFGAGTSHAVNIDLGAGNDTLVVNALANVNTPLGGGVNAANNTQLAQDLIKVANFGSGDSINVASLTSGNAANGTGTLTVSTVDLSTATSLYQAFSSVIGAAVITNTSDGATPPVITTTVTPTNQLFQYGGNTYIAHSDASAAVTPGDGLIELTGFQGTLLTTAAAGVYTAA